MTRPQELLATFAACSVAVGAVTLALTERSTEDWRVGALSVLAVTFGTAMRQVIQRRKEQRRPSVPGATD